MDTLGDALSVALMSTAIIGLVVCLFWAYTADAAEVGD